MQIKIDFCRRDDFHTMVIESVKPSASNFILALDVSTGIEALQWVKRMSPFIGCFKVGLQLFNKEGAGLVERLREQNVEIFLDLKLHDIPNTVAKAIESVALLQPKFLTIHTLGGPEMLRAAQAACPAQTTLLGVTVLTSMNRQALEAIGIARSVEEQVVLLAKVAVKAGLQALVCSPLEIKVLREALGPHVQLVTPGIRPAGALAHDQARTMSIQDALAAGANYLVIGRPILENPNPEKLMESILAA